MTGQPCEIGREVEMASAAQASAMQESFVVRFRYFKDMCEAGQQAVARRGKIVDRLYCILCKLEFTKKDQQVPMREKWLKKRDFLQSKLD